MAPKEKKKGGQGGAIATRSKGDGSAKKKSQSRAEKAGLAMSVSKVHNHMLKHKMHPNTKGVTRVSVSAPVWVTAALEYFAAELIEQAGLKTTDPKQKGGARKRITVEDVVHALRGDAEMDRAMTGFRILAGDKIAGKKITGALTFAAPKLKATDDAGAAAGTAEA